MFIIQCELCKRDIYHSPERDHTHHRPGGLATRYEDYQTVCIKCRNTPEFGPKMRNFKKHKKTDRRCRVCDEKLNETRYFFCEHHTPQAEVDEHYLKTKRAKHFACSTKSNKATK